jgi:hypothetical protein
MKPSKFDAIIEVAISVQTLQYSYKVEGRKPQETNTKSFVP